jgi:hypothetical protein
MHFFVITCDSGKTDQVILNVLVQDPESAVELTAGYTNTVITYQAVVHENLTRSDTEYSVYIGEYTVFTPMLDTETVHFTVVASDTDEVKRLLNVKHNVTIHTRLGILNKRTVVKNNKRVTVKRKITPRIVCLDKSTEIKSVEYK